MRFLTKAFVIVAAATALFSSPAEAFTTESIRSHASTLHSHIQSNHDALRSNIRSIQFHAEAMSDCISAGFTPTEANVKACLSIEGAPAFNPNCAANLNGDQCKTDIGKATALWFAKEGGGISGGISGGGNDGGNNAPDMSKCAAAMDKFNLNVQTKCEAVTKSISNIPPTITNIGDILNAQCAAMSGPAFGECKAALSTVAEIQNDCPIYGLGQIKAKVKTIFQMLDGPISAVCTPDDADSSKYCLASILSTASTNPFDIEKVTDNTFNQMCKPCLQTVVNKIAALGGNFGSFDNQKLKDGLSAFQAFCVKDPTNPSKFCMNTFLSLAKAEKEKKSPDLNAVCSPCLDAVVMNAKSLLPTTVLDEFNFIKYYVCERDNNGAFCSNVFESQGEVALTPIVMACSVPASTCTAECKAAVETLYNKQSCCFPKLGMRNLGRVLEFSGDTKAKAVLPAINNAALCMFDTISASSCDAPTAEIPITISLANIDATRISNDQAVRQALSVALQSDLSAALSLNANAIVIGKFEADPTTKGGVKVSFTIKVDAAFRGGYASAFNQKLQQGALPLPLTAKEAETRQAEIDDTQPLTAGGQGALASGAVHASGSIVAVVAMAIVAAVAARF